MKKTATILGAALCLLTSATAQNYELWGVTQQSGDDGKGTIYKTDAQGANPTEVHSFSIGSRPTGSLVQAANGRLYGATSFGGTNDLGTLFSVDPVTESFTIHWSLSANTGSGPRGSFMEASNGMLYITTYAGGSNGKGTILELDPTNHNLVIRHHFGGTSTEPSQPLTGELIETTIGKLYGMSRYGGANGDGTIYEYDLSNHSVTVLFDFDGQTTGAQPFNSLEEASSGLLYGMTNVGGSENGGTLFAYDIAMDTFEVQNDFISAGGIGTKPQGALFEGSDGLLYGMTSTSGYLFSFDMSTKVTTGLYAIGDVRGTVMQASNDNLYGVTYGGGVFQYDIAGGNYSVQGNAGTYCLYGQLLEVPVSTVGLDEEIITNNPIHIYPNPAQATVNFETDLNIKQVNIFSISGELVTTSNETSVNIAYLDAGVYIAVVVTDQGVFKEKILKY